MDARRNVLVLGSGRSGTSMVAGTLARAGWYAGDDLYPPRHSNPKGFFESPAINQLNEYLLAGVLDDDARFQSGQRWLSELPLGRPVPADARARGRMAALVRNRPYCFKDPRFCYTLPAWREHVEGALLLCVFRDPAVTARSIVQECRSESYLSSLPMDFDCALRVWERMYRHVLERHRSRGEWLFLHYEQLLTPPGLDRLERAVGAPVSRGFPEQGLRRTQASDPLPGPVAELYEELCALAGWHSERPRRLHAAPAAPELAVIVDGRRCTHPDEAVAGWRTLAQAHGGIEVAAVGAHQTLDAVLARTRAPWLLLLDGDSVPAAATLDAHVATLRASDPRCAHAGAGVEHHLRELLEGGAGSREASRSHLLVSREALAEAGGAEGTLGRGWAGDLDLALRFADRGVTLMPSTAPLGRRPRRGIDQLLREERERGLAWPGLCRAHPRLLGAPEWQWARAESAQDRERFLVGRLDRLPRLLALVRPLEHLQLEGPAAGAAASLARALAPALRELAEVHRREGLAEGLQALGCSDLAALESTLPWPLSTRARERLLAWPDYGDAAELDQLLKAVAPAPGKRDLCLCLRHDAEVDPPLEQAVESLQLAWGRILPGEAELEVMLLTEPLPPAAMPRLARSVTGVVAARGAVPSVRSEFLAAVAADAGS